MAKVSSSGQTVIDTKASSLMTRELAKVSTTGQTVARKKVCGKTTIMLAQT